MNSENPWTRLSRLIYARIDHLGIDQGELHARFGGPSPAWIRRIKTYTGPPSAKSNKALRSLSLSLGWSEGTARSILTDDRSGWSQELLDAEEHDLIYGESPDARATSEPSSLVKRLADMVRSDPMAGVSEAEWADLLEAIESKMPHHNEDGHRGERPQGKTGT